MNQREWDGQPLAGECVAVTVVTLAAGDEDPPLVVAAASTGDHRCVIETGRLGDFLLAHGNHLIACHDAAALHWTLEPHLRAAGQWDAWKGLWGFSLDSRLFDVRLFDQLVFLGGYGGHPPPRGLADLALFYGVVTPDGFGGIGRYPIAVPAGTTGPTDELTLDEVTRAADLIHGIFRRQKGEADETVALLRIDPGTVRRFGTLTVGVQVRGAIALGRAARNGLRISEEVVPKLRKLGSVIHRESSILLENDPAARE